MSYFDDLEKLLEEYDWKPNNQKKTPKITVLNSYKRRTLLDQLGKLQTKTDLTVLYGSKLQVPTLVLTSLQNFTVLQVQVSQQ